MPLQRVVERDALRGPAARGDRPAAADRARARPAAPPAACRGLRATPRGRRRARRCCRTCRAREPAPRAAINLRRDPQHPLAASDQKPLQRARDVPAVLDRPDPLAPRPRAQPSSAANPRARPRRSARRAARRSPQRPPRPCASACGCPHRARSLTSSTSTSTEVDSPADMACWGRCHAPIKSRRDIPDRRRATQRKAVRPHGRQPERESARRRSGPSPQRRTSPTTRITTASLKPAG